MATIDSANLANTDLRGHQCITVTVTINGLVKLSAFNAHVYPNI